MVHQISRSTKKRRIKFQVIYGVSVILFVLVSLEVLLRLLVNYNPSYYVGFYHRKNKTISFPYGIIKYNSLGYPDDEFLAKKTKPRIGYFGDSVCYGVGAGYGYRVSELLEDKLPQYEHMNFSMIGTDISQATVDIIHRHVELFALDKVVFLMNLNDVFPTDVHYAGPESLSAGVKRTRRGLLFLRSLSAHLDWLRGRSYLYTQLRIITRAHYVRTGFESHGQVAYEFYPTKYEDIIAQTAARVNALSKSLRELQGTLIVVILPYEMQISKAAETRYAECGVQWEPNFIYGGTQQLIIAHLDSVICLDARYAFIADQAKEPAAVDASRQENDVGEFFVYNLGGNLDWNHLNRKGHRRLAEFLYERHVLSGPDVSGQSAPGTSPLSGLLPR